MARPRRAELAPLVRQVAYFKERGETVLSMKLTKNDKDGAASPPFGTSPVAPCELDRMTAHCHAPNDKSGTIVDAGDADPPPLGPCIAETVPACCWMQILQNCTVADVAAMSGTCTWMRSMCQVQKEPEPKPCFLAQTLLAQKVLALQDVLVHVCLVVQTRLN